MGKRGKRTKNKIENKKVVKSVAKNKVKDNYINKNPIKKYNNEFIKHLILYQKYYWVFLITLITFVVFSSAFDNDFVNWDDDRYITGNPQIKEFSFKSIVGFFTNFYFLMYIPISITSYAVDYYIGNGLNPFVFHFTNVLFHLLNTVLVFIFIYKISKLANSKYFLELAIISSVLFGITTLHVESVVWVSERKDVLYSFFFLLSLIIYLKYVKTNNLKFLVLALLFFVFALMSKAMSVVLSLCIVAIDYYLKRNLLNKKVILEKIPFFALSLLFGIIAIYALGTEEPFVDPYKTPTPETEARPFYENIVFASYGFITYIVKLIVPYNLSAIYPYPPKNEGIPIEFWFYPLPVLAIIYAFIKSLKKNLHIAFSIAFFTFNVFFVLQIFSYQSFIMTDRYSYMSSIGLFFLIGYLATKLLEKNNKLKIPLIAVFVVYLTFISIKTYARVNVWQNSITLWEDVNEKNPNVIVAYYNKGNAYQAKGELKKAIDAYSSAAKLNPKHLGAFSNRGICKAQLNDVKGALNDFNTVVKVDSNYANVYSNRGNAKVMLKDDNGALADYNRAIQRNPNHKDALFNRGLIKNTLKDYNGAILDFDKVIKINAQTVNAYLNKGIAQVNLNMNNKAIENFSITIKMQNNSPLAFYYRATTYDKIGKKELARKDYDMLNKLQPDFVKSSIQLGNYYDQQGQSQMAINEFNKAIYINPNYEEAYVRRGVVYAKSKKYKIAINDFNKAININPNSSTAYTNRGFAKELTGNNAEALKDYDKAIKVSPESIVTYNNRAFLRNKLKLYKLAIEDFSTLINLSPQSGKYYYNRAKTYVLMNKFDKACLDFKKAKELKVNTDNLIKKYCTIVSLNN